MRAHLNWLISRLTFKSKQTPTRNIATFLVKYQGLQDALNQSNANSYKPINFAACRSDDVGLCILV